MALLPPLRDLVVFITAATVLLAIPGPAVLYIVTRSVDRGPKAGLASASGIATGGLVHVLAATPGLSALVLSSALAFSAMKFGGAAYLIYLGIRKLRESPAPFDGGVPACPVSLKRVFGQAITVQILNPKTAVFGIHARPR